MDSHSPSTPCTPWNKGKLIGQKAPLRPKDIWESALGYRWITEPANSRCLTWVWTANCATAIS